MTQPHRSIGVYAGEALAAYGFGEEHPFGPDRFRVFWTRFQKLGLEEQTQVLKPVAGNEDGCPRLPQQRLCRPVKGPLGQR